MASKNLAKSFDNVADMKPCEDAIVHGVITNVSPMKMGASPYFDAKLCDEQKNARLVGFTTSQRKRLISHETTMDPVALSGVKIKKARNSEDLEIVLKSTSDVINSPKKFSSAKISKASSNRIVLKDLSSKNNYDRISFKAKVTRIDPPTKVSPTLQKQEVTIADSSAAAKLTLWNDARPLTSLCFV